jgi:Bacterial Ig-like domain (group 2)
MGVSTSEREPNRALMVVGEEGHARVDAYSEEGLGVTLRAGDVTYTSSSPAVVRITDLGTEARLEALAPGSARISATVGQVVDTAHIAVIAEPLPLDGLRVTLVEQWNDLPAESDSSSSLRWIEVPIGQSGALTIVGLRGGVEVTLPWEITSSDSTVVLAAPNCRPRTIDPNCDVFSDAWLTGVAAGQATITTSARNVTSSFLAEVP